MDKKRIIVQLLLSAFCFLGGMAGGSMLTAGRYAARDNDEFARQLAANPRPPQLSEAQLDQLVAKCKGFQDSARQYADVINDYRGSSTVLYEPNVGGQLALGALALMLHVPGAIAGPLASSLAGQQPRWVIPVKITPQLAAGDGTYSWWHSQTQTMEGPFAAEGVNR